MTIPPLLFALMLWFIGTAAVVWLDSRPQHTFRTSFTLVGWLALIATEWLKDADSQLEGSKTAVEETQAALEALQAKGSGASAAELAAAQKKADAAVERKMVKKALVGHLATTLEHTGSENLLVLAVMFLKKLSVFEGNKNEMRERNLVAKIVARIPSSSEQFGLAALRLLFNLSFDPAIREQMVKAGAIGPVIQGDKEEKAKTDMLNTTRVVDMSAACGIARSCDAIADPAGSSSSLCAGRASRRPRLTSRRLPSAACVVMSCRKVLNSDLLA